MRKLSRHQHVIEAIKESLSDHGKALAPYNQRTEEEGEQRNNQQYRLAATILNTGMRSIMAYEEENDTRKSVMYGPAQGRDGGDQVILNL